MADATQMLINLATNLAPVSKLVTGAAYLMGVAMIFKALYHLKIYGELRTMMASQTSIKEPLTYIFVGSMLIFFPTGVDIMMNTTFGYNNPLAYQEWPSAGGGQLGIASQALLFLVQIVGLVAFIRGWLYIAKSSSSASHGQGFGKGLTHLFGGLFAMNIVGTANIISKTFGINLI